MRSVPRSEQWNETNTMCFAQTSSGQYRLRPLYYVSDSDKQWYKEYYGIRYSDAYEVYGLTSPSPRRAWIEISISAFSVMLGVTVALPAEGVD